MEIALTIGSGLFFLATVFVYLAAFSNVFRSARPDHGLPGFKGGAGGAEERLAGILSATSRREARVAPYSLGEMEAGLRFSIEGLCTTVTFWRPGTVPPKRVSLRDAQPIGDPSFDRAFQVAGPRDHTLAILTEGVRRSIRDLLLGNVRIGQLKLEAGTFVADIPTAGFASEHPGLDKVAEAVALASTSLGTPPDVVPRLSDNLAHDPASGVRLQSLLALRDAHASDPRTRAAATAALQDPDRRVRLEAALMAGGKGRATLVALAADTATEDELAVRALDALGSDLPIDRIGPLLREAAFGPEHEAARPRRTRAFLAALARNRTDAAGDVLKKLVRDADDAYGPVVVDAIAAVPRRDAEGTLLEALLAHTTNPGLLRSFADRKRTQEAAARALGDVGTIDAVLPLREAERRGGAIASAARASIAKIQERFAGSRGRLALTDTEAGRLSEAEDPSGRVSLPRDET